MKIVDIKDTWISIPGSEVVRMGRFGKIYKDPYPTLSLDSLKEGSKGTFQSQIVQVITDEGIVGIGERERHLWRKESEMTYMKSSLIGFDPFDIEAIVESQQSVFAGYPQGIAAIEIACWDIIGKRTGVPIYKLMGGPVRDKVYVTRFIGIKSTEETVRDALEAVESGIKTIKLKVGQDPKKDLETIKAVREAVGDFIEIRVDSNQSWSVPTAINMINRMERYFPQFIEEPIPWWDHDGLARVKARTRVPICICEGYGYSISGLPRLMDLIKKDAIDFISTDPLRTGGMLGFKKLCAVCESAGIPVVTHWTRAGVTQAAWLHCCVSNNATMYANDILCSNLKPSAIDDIITKPFKHENGYLKVPKGPGLGVVLDQEKLVKWKA